MTEPPTLDPAALRDQLGEPYGQFDAAAQQRHATMLAAVRHAGDVRLWAEPLGEDRWSVTIVAADAVGGLSTIAGLLTAARVNIRHGDVFTVRVPGELLPQTPPRRSAARGGVPPRVARRPRPAEVPPSRRLLDILEVDAPQGADRALWERLEADLARLTGRLTAEGSEVRAEVIEQVSAALRESDPEEATLLPVEIDIDNRVDPDATVLAVRSVDTRGFLFEFANAVSMLDLNIVRAEIRTVEGESRDRFWITDAAGQRLTDAQRLRELRVATALIKQFTHLLPRSPNPAQALRQFSSLSRQILQRADWTGDLLSLQSSSVLATLAQVLGISEFLWEDFLRMQHENVFPLLGDEPMLQRARPRAELAADLARALEDAEDAEARIQVLNRFKDREMFRIDLRHLTGRIGMAEFAAALSDLAEVVFGGATGLAQASPGRPAAGGDEPAPWAVGALGKLGGRELGFASDIEFLFVFDDRGGDGELQQYFERMVRATVQAIHARRSGIFEMDLRLRPHGEGGPLAVGLGGFQRYYSADGEAQQFERLALVKLRPIAGSAALGEEMERLRDAWVYSGAPLDRANIRHLRRRQAEELVAPGAVNAKYSAGGIVDIEYFVQALQIEAGAADPTVRTTSTLEGIEQLRRGGHLAAEQAARLSEAYLFLRRLIDGLRSVRGNARDLVVPPADSAEFAYLSRRLGSASPERLTAAIEQHTEIARELWRADAEEPPMGG